jgi:hypothetical protein
MGWSACRGHGTVSLDLAAMQEPLTPTPAQARRKNRRLLRAGVRESSQLRAGSASAPAYDSEVVDIDFASIATQPDYYMRSLLQLQASR